MSVKTALGDNSPKVKLFDVCQCDMSDSVVCEVRGFSSARLAYAVALELLKYFPQHTVYIVKGLEEDQHNQIKIK